MNETLENILIGIGVLALIIGTIFGITFLIESFKYDPEFVTSGEIQSMELVQDQDSSSMFYFCEVNNKTFRITQYDYYEFNIGDVVEVWQATNSETYLYFRLKLKTEE